MQKLLAIFNRNAGNFSEQEVENIDFILAASPFLEATTAVTTTLDELVIELQNYYHKYGMPDILAIGSGDGGAHIALTEAAKTFAKLPQYLAPFSLGTMIQYAVPFQLNNGVIDRVNRLVRSSFGIQYLKPLETKAEQLAFYITEQTGSKLPLHSSPLGVIEVNGKRGFNFGIGLVSKLIWLYEGATVEQYQQMVATAERNGTFQTWPKPAEATVARFENLPKSYLPWEKRTNLFSAASVVSSAILSTASHNGIASFLTQPTQVEIYINGNKLPTEEITGLVISTYETISLGINGFTFHPTYRARAQCNDKQFHCVATSLSARELLPYLRDLYVGRQLRNTAVYDAMAEHVLIKFPQPTLYQMDGELYLAKEISIIFDSTVQIIHPLAKKLFGRFTHFLQESQ